MSTIDLFRDLANAVNKSVGGGKKLANPSTPTDEVAGAVAEASAAANVVSAIVEAMRTYRPEYPIPPRTNGNKRGQTTVFETNEQTGTDHGFSGFRFPNIIESGG